MPIIKSSADLRNNYNYVSQLCHENREAVFITKNGKGDLAVMSIEQYENMMGRIELYSLLQDGLEDIREGRTRDFDEALSDLRRRTKNDI